MTYLTDPRDRPPARALRQCGGCGRLITGAVQVGGVWVCGAPSCTSTPPLQMETAVTRFALARRCDTCGTEDPQHDVRLVHIIEQGSGPGGGVHACTVCVPLGDGEMDQPADTTPSPR